MLMRVSAYFAAAVGLALGADDARAEDAQGASSRSENWWGENIASALNRVDVGAALSQTSTDFGAESYGVNLTAIRETSSEFTNPELTDSPRGVASLQLNNPLHRDDEARLNYLWATLNYEGASAEDAFGPDTEYDFEEASLLLGGQAWARENTFVGGSIWLTRQSYDYRTETQSDSVSYNFFGLEAFAGLRDQLSWSRFTDYSEEQIAASVYIVNNFDLDDGGIVSIPVYNFEYAELGYSFFLPLCAPVTAAGAAGQHICEGGLPDRLRVSFSGAKEFGQAQVAWAEVTLGLSGTLRQSDVGDTTADGEVTHYLLSLGYSSYDYDEGERMFAGEDHSNLGGASALFEVRGFEYIFQREARIGLGYYKSDYERSGEAETWVVSLRFGGSRKG